MRFFHFLNYFTSESHTDTPPVLGGTLQGIGAFITPHGDWYDCYISYSDNRLF